MNLRRIRERRSQLERELREELRGYENDPEYQAALERMKRVRRRWQIAAQTKVTRLKSDLEKTEAEMKAEIRRRTARRCPPEWGQVLEHLGRLHSEIATGGEITWISPKEDWIMVRIRKKWQKTQFWFFRIDMEEHTLSIHPGVLKIESGENKEATNKALKKIKEQLAN